MNIGEAIRKMRLKKSLSQGELAELCGISQTSMYQIEKGIKRPSSKNMGKICKILGVPEPVIYLYAMEEKDVSKEKRAIFNTMYPTMNSLIETILVK